MTEQLHLIQITPLNKLQGTPPSQGSQKVMPQIKLTSSSPSSPPSFFFLSSIFGVAPNLVLGRPLTQPRFLLTGLSAFLSPGGTLDFPVAGP
jgi:hypothetical protein